MIRQKEEFPRSGKRNSIDDVTQINVDMLIPVFSDVRTNSGPDLDSIRVPKFGLTVVPDGKT